MVLKRTKRKLNAENKRNIFPWNKKCIIISDIDNNTHGNFHFFCCCSHIILEKFKWNLYYIESRLSITHCHKTVGDFVGIFHRYIKNFIGFPYMKWIHFKEKWLLRNLKPKCRRFSMSSTPPLPTKNLIVSEWPPSIEWLYKEWITKYNHSFSLRLA